MNLFFCAWLLGFWIPSFEENPTSLTHPRAWHPLSQGIARLPTGALKVWYDANSVTAEDIYWGYGYEPHLGAACLRDTWIDMANATAGESTIYLHDVSYSFLKNTTSTGILLRLEGDPTQTVYEITGPVNGLAIPVTPAIQHSMSNARVLIAQISRWRDKSGNRRDMGTWPLADSFSPSVYVSDGTSGALYMDGFRYHFGNGAQILTDVTTGGVVFGAPSGEASAGVQELIIGTAAALDENTRLQLEGYLAWKWQGQGKLAPTHPYAEMPPNWEPSILNTNLLLWLDANHTPSLFSDSACTTLASSGQAIGCWQDRSSYERHMLQSNTALQPGYWDAPANIFGASVPGIRANAGQHLSTAPATWLNGTPVFVAAVVEKTNTTGRRFANGPIWVSSSSNNANNDWWVFPYDSSNCIGMQRQQGSTRQDYPWARTPFWQKETIQERSVYVAASRDFISWRPKPSLFTRDAPLYFNNQPYLIAMVARREMGYQTMFLNILYDIISFGSDFFAPDTTFWIKNQFSANYQHVNTPTLYLVWKKAANEAPQVRVNGRSLEPSWWNPTYVSVPDNTYTTLTIGDRAGNNQRLEGRLYEIMVLTGPLKEPHHRIIEGYLAWKWGLEKSLPRRHPYYRVPPGK